MTWPANAESRRVAGVAQTGTATSNLDLATDFLIDRSRIERRIVAKVEDPRAGGVAVDVLDGDALLDCLRYHGGHHLRRLTQRQLHAREGPADR